MSAMWKLEKDLCRCCHAEGSFKHLSDPCFLLGQEEIYSIMLQDCLDIKIVPMTGPLCDATYTICESCVARLRDASNFKRQVQDCEERFKEMYSKNMIKGFEVKDEPFESDADMKQEFQSIEEDEDDDDAFMKFDDDDASSYEEHEEREEMITVEVEAEPRAKGKGKGKAKPKPKPKKAPAKKTKTKEKSIKEETEDLTEAAVSGEKKKDEEKHQMKACFKCKKIRKVEELGDTKSCPDCATGLTNCVVRLVREQLQAGPITNFFITTEESVDNGQAKSEPQAAGSSAPDAAPASVLRDFLLRGLAGNSKKDENESGKTDNQKVKKEDSDNDSLESLDMKMEDFEVYGCVECQKTFNKKSGLQKHIRNLHRKVLQKCPDCGDSFPTKRTLQNHAKKVHDKNTEPEKVSIQPKYRDFIKVHNGKKPKYACRICGYEIKNRARLMHHIRSSHIPQLTCPTCDDIFPDQNLLQAHTSQPHQRKYPCQSCELIFPTHAKLMYHRKHKHTQIQCSSCPDVTFYTSKERRIHMFKFHEDRLPTCGVCGLKTMSQGQIDKHQRKVHLKEKHVECPVCNYQCFDNPQLKKHMIRHKVDKVYSCRFCKKTFPRPGTCRIHEMIHTGERNKVCELCNASFVQKASLNYHMLKHHPDHV
ncbi:zinc finger and BTB domain-containing protein 17-like isoform X3 [Cydia fagiglandana]|uniref:zinc finger and BTB domain-containing protein 17-like isoform X3 n=1 Tax=Cydia fagiglandana TaxID=1458189 RepID=UPI002FEE271E